jgi:hypothetical protein
MLRFAVHGLSNPIASPRSHGVPRRDVSCRVHVSVERETAGHAPEGGLTLARLPVHLAARATALTGKRGVCLMDPARGLLVQAADQQSPPRRQNLPIQSGLLARSLHGVVSGPPGTPRHVLDMQIFDADQIEPASQIPTAFGDEHFPRIPVQPTHMMGLDRDNAESFVAPSLAPRRPTMRACEEIAHGLVKVAERLLLDHLAAVGQPRISPPRSGELPALLQVPRRARPSRTPPRLLLAGQVPHKPGVCAVFPQERFVGGRREQAVAGHTKTLSSTTDIPEEVKRRPPSCSWQGISTPRTG